MIWKIELTSNAYKFLERNKIPEEKFLDLLEKRLENFKEKRLILM